MTKTNQKKVQDQKKEEEEDQKEEKKNLTKMIDISSDSSEISFGSLEKPKNKFTQNESKFVPENIQRKYNKSFVPYKGEDQEMMSVLKLSQMDAVKSELKKIELELNDAFDENNQDKISKLFAKSEELNKQLAQFEEENQKIGSQPVSRNYHKISQDFFKVASSDSSSDCRMTPQNRSQQEQIPHFPQPRLSSGSRKSSYDESQCENQMEAFENLRGFEGFYDKWVNNKAEMKKSFLRVVPKQTNQQKESSENDWPKYIGSLACQEFIIFERQNPSLQTTYKLVAPDFNQYKTDRGLFLPQNVIYNYNFCVHIKHPQQKNQNKFIGIINNPSWQLFPFLLYKEYIQANLTLIKFIRNQNKKQIYQGRIDIYLCKAIIQNPIAVPYKTHKDEASQQRSKWGKHNSDSESDENPELNHLPMEEYKVIKSNQQFKKKLNQFCRESLFELFQIMSIKILRYAYVKPENKTEKFSYMITKFNRVFHQNTLGYDHNNNFNAIGSINEIVLNIYPHRKQYSEYFKNQINSQKLDSEEENGSLENSLDEISIEDAEGLPKAVQVNDDLINKSLHVSLLPTDTPSCMTQQLFEHQKKALSWMLFQENKVKQDDIIQKDYQELTDFDPFYALYQLPDGTQIYINTFTGEARLTKPQIKVFQGGILADQMGLGQTIVGIALICSTLEQTDAEKIPQEIQIENAKEEIETKKIEKNKQQGNQKKISFSTQTQSGSKRTLKQMLQDDEEDQIQSQENFKQKEDQEDLLELKYSNKKQIQNDSQPKLKATKKIGESSQSDFDDQSDLDMNDHEDSDYNIDQKQKSPLKQQIISQTIGKFKDEIQEELNQTQIQLSPLQQSLELAKEKIQLKKAQNLIVVPLSVITQWLGELNTYTKPNTLKVLEYYNQKSKTLDLSLYDVVITTYETLGNEYRNQKIKNQPEKTHLFDYEWTRIFLDEAQQIKSKQSNMASGSIELQGQFQWVFTGTPIQNDLGDLFNLFKFIGIEHFMHYSFFFQQVIDRYYRDQNLSILRFLLEQNMLRRTKKEVQLSEESCQLLQIEDQDETVVKVKMNSIERRFYNSLKDRTSQYFKKLIREKNLEQQYAHIFQIICRLRMVCDHLNLVFNDEDLSQIQNPDDIKQVIDIFFKNINQVQDLKEVGENQIVAGPSFADQAKAELLEDNQKVCSVCLEIIEVITMFQCFHYVCSKCFNQIENCPMRCGQIQEFIEFDLNQLQKLPQLENDQKLEQVKLSSSKLDAVMTKIDEIYNQSTDQCIIFTQWIKMMDLITSKMDQQQYSFIVLNGSQSQVEREKLLQEFNDDPNQRFMLSTMKAGGVGLNLTVANHVLIVDPWWNPSVQDQATGRVYRIGQTKISKITRFVCEQTIEERMLSLHVKKRKLFNDALKIGNQDKEKKEIFDDYQYLLEFQNVEEQIFYKRSFGNLQINYSDSDDDLR